jgi:methylthioribose-1-phosphate isomerase
MSTRSPASSGTEGVEQPEEPDRPAAPAPPAPTTPDHDASRRAFFREFGRQAVGTVGQLAAMADVMGRATDVMAGQLLGTETRPQRPPPTRFTRPGAIGPSADEAAPPSAEDVFRSPYRVAGGSLVILDQRRLPEVVEEVTAKRASDVAFYLRLGVARGGPLMAQLAAYGLALTAAERADQQLGPLLQALRKSGQALMGARPSARLLEWAVARMLAVAEALAPGAEVSVIESEDADAARAETGGTEQAEVVADGNTAPTGPAQELITRLRAEADDLAMDMTRWHAAMAEGLVGALPDPGDRPLTVLMHGSQGPLLGGQVGSGLTALMQLRDAGRPLRVFVTEGRPHMDGARLASWELRQAGIDHHILADGAVAWLFAREPVDAVLLSADRVAVNGDTAALVGSAAIAWLAAGVEVAGPRPRVLVSGPAACADPGIPDRSAMPDDLRPASELSAYLSGVPIRVSDALVPATDVIPTGLIDVWIDESGARAGGVAG